jgi:hypothetical protein
LPSGIEHPSDAGLLGGFDFLILDALDGNLAEVLIRTFVFNRLRNPSDTTINESVSVGRKKVRSKQDTLKRKLKEKVV